MVLALDCDLALDFDLALGCVLARSCLERGFGVGIAEPCAGSNLCAEAAARGRRSTPEAHCNIES